MRILKSIRNNERTLTEDKNNNKMTKYMKAKNKFEKQLRYVVPDMLKSSLIPGHLYEGLTLRYL